MILLMLTAHTDCGSVILFARSWLVWPPTAILARARCSGGPLPTYGQKRFGDAAQVWTGRLFVVGVTIVAYFTALRLKDEVGIFELAIRFAFSGFAALAPIMVAALFWKRSTKWGALAAVLWVAAAVIGTWYLHGATQSIAPPPGQPPVPIFPALGNVLLRTTGNVTVYGFLPVMPMVLVSALLVWLFSVLTRPPSQATLERYFPSRLGR